LEGRQYDVTLFTEVKDDGSHETLLTTAVLDLNGTVAVELLDITISREACGVPVMMERNKSYQ